MLGAEKSLEGRDRWRVVYRLSTDLHRDPRRIELTQQRTLDPAHPTSGLKGSQGLYGSEQWWQSINSGRIPLVLKTGTISRLYYAGMDSHRKNNSCEVAGDDGRTFHGSVLVDRPAHHSRYKVGARVAYLFAMDEWKAASLLGPEPENSGQLIEVALAKRR